MDYWTNVIDVILIFYMVALALNLVLGFSGMVSLAHAIYFGIGAYGFALLSQHNILSPIPAWVTATLATGLISSLSAFPALRVRDEYLILLTLALQMIASGIMNSWISVTNGPSGIPGITPITLFGHQLFTPTQCLPLLLFVTVCVVTFLSILVRSPFGRVLKGIRENEVATISLGKNVVAKKFYVFAVSGLISGLAGVLFAQQQGFINPLSFNLNTSILLVAIVALGGAANLYGTLVGTVLILGIPELLTFLNLGTTDTVSAVRGIIFGLLLIIFTRYRPKGILPERYHASRSLSTDSSAAAGGAWIGVSRDDAPVSDSLGPDWGPPISVEGLSKRFGGLITADNLNFKLEAGRITVLVGPNGAGKTTLFNLLSGLLSPDGGRICIRNQDITSLAAWRRVTAGIGRTFQDVRIFENLTVLDNVLMAFPNQPGEHILSLFLAHRKVLKQERSHRALAMKHLQKVGLAPKANELAAALSYGEQKLLALVRLVATEADILLLDEPAAGVDDSWTHKMLGLIRELADQGKTICLVEHNMSVVKQIADSVYFMDAGAIIAHGTPEEIIHDPELGKLYFGTGS